MGVMLFGSHKSFSVWCCSSPPVHKWGNWKRGFKTLSRGIPQQGTKPGSRVQQSGSWVPPTLTLTPQNFSELWERRGSFHHTREVVFVNPSVSSSVQGEVVKPSCPTLGSFKGIFVKMIWNLQSTEESGEFELFSKHPKYKERQKGINPCWPQTALRGYCQGQITEYSF